jgi:hypothetical protein
MYLQDARIKVGYICMYVGHIYMYLHGYGVSILNFIEFIVLGTYVLGQGQTLSVLG